MIGEGNDELRNLFDNDVVGEDGTISTDAISLCSKIFDANGEDGIWSGDDSDAKLPTPRSTIHLNDDDSEKEEKKEEAKGDAKVATGGPITGAGNSDTQNEATSPAFNVVRRKKKKMSDKVIYVLDTKYDVLSSICMALQWKDGSTDDDFDILWSDHTVSVEFFIKMKSYQRVNHFIGMCGITRKNSLGRNLLRMRKHFAQEFSFFPDTWILPTDLTDFKTQFIGKKNRTFIMKPDNGYQGKGIFLTRELPQIDFSQTMVAQRYLSKPFLLDGCKFDLRLYVLVTGCDPLRIFLHKEGLVRLATEAYVQPKNKNITNTMMHLTNYAINSKNPNFEQNVDPDDPKRGHKRSWRAVLQALENDGHDTAKLQDEINDIIVKTLVAVQPSLSHVYKSCQPDDVDNAMSFEILGFDIMLGWKLKPWLIEVNHAPSFATESKLDSDVKSNVLRDAFFIVNPNAELRRKYKKESRQMFEQRTLGVHTSALQRRNLIMSHKKEELRRRDIWEETASLKTGYSKLYPPSAGSEDPYKVYIDKGLEIWEILTGTQKRPKKKDEEEKKKASQNAKQKSRKEKDVVAEGPAQEGNSGSSSSGKFPTTTIDADRHAAGRSHSTSDVCSSIVASLASGDVTTLFERSRAADLLKNLGNTQGDSDTNGQLFYGERSVRNVDDIRGTNGGENETVEDPLPASTPAESSTPGNVKGHGVGATSIRTWRGSDVKKYPEVFVAAQQKAEIRRSTDVPIGGQIKVETNLGWECVLIRKKYTDGKMDIVFQDGEVMCEVMPRIMKSPCKQSEESKTRASPACRSSAPARFGKMIAKHQGTTPKSFPDPLTGSTVSPTVCSVEGRGHPKSEIRRAWRPKMPKQISSNDVHEDGINRHMAKFGCENMKSDVSPTRSRSGTCTSAPPPMRGVTLKNFYGWCKASRSQRSPAPWLSRSQPTPAPCLRRSRQTPAPHASPAPSVPPDRTLNALIHIKPILEGHKTSYATRWRTSDVS